MMRVGSVAVAFATLLVIAPVGAAVGDQGPVIVSTTENGIWAGVTIHHSGSTVPGMYESATGAATSSNSSSLSGAAAELITEPIDSALLDTFCLGVNWTTGCVPAEIQPAVAPTPVTATAVAGPPTLTPGMVAQAFRSIDLPASELAVQPPNGRTLVNFATNFYTEQGSFSREVRLLGQRVELRIRPSRFAWQFGDGRSLATAEPGAPYPDLEVTHEYLVKGGVSPSVDTTYAARFRVNGGAWRDVDGTVTIAGEPVGLEVLTATPELVGYR